MQAVGRQSALGGLTVGEMSEETRRAYEEVGHQAAAFGVEMDRLRKRIGDLEEEVRRSVGPYVLCANERQGSCRGFKAARETP